MLTPTEELNEDFQLLESIHNYLENKSKIDSTKSDKINNILIKFLKDPEIIKDNKTNDLPSFIEELSKQISKGNYIILPFIDPCYDLIEAYIKSDNDKIEWNKIFTQLIENSFINRKNLIPIYAYFTELFSIFNNQNEKEEKEDDKQQKFDNLSKCDELLKKFKKMVNLWTIFYSLSEKKK